MKDLKRSPHLVLRVLMLVNVFATIVFWRFGYYFVIEANGVTRGIGAFLFVYLTISSSLLIIFVIVAAFRVASQRDRGPIFDRERRDLLIDALLVVAAFVLWHLQPYTFFTL